MANNKKVILSALAVLTAILLAFAFLSGYVQNAFAERGGKAPDKERVIYYAHKDLQSNNFGPDALVEAQKQVDEGKVAENIAAIWRVNSDSNAVEGIFYDRMYHDPALLGAITTDILSRSDVEWKDILGDRWQGFKKYDKDHAIGQLPDQLHLAFLKDEAFWDQTLASVVSYLKKDSAPKIVDLSGYKYSMYMLDNKLEGDKPMVVVRSSTRSGGHAVQFEIGKVVYSFRLECGFQPIEPTYWQPPEGSEPVPDNPEPSNPTPSEPNPPEPETEKLEPKDPDAGPRAQTGDKNPDYGGDQGKPDTTQDEEPKSPDTYTPPKAPTNDGGGSGNGGSSGGSSNSGSPTVDRDNGKVEQHNGQDYNVTAGDGQSHTDLNKVQQEAKPETVEKPVQGDGTNTGDIAPPE